MTTEVQSFSAFNFVILRLNLVFYSGEFERILQTFHVCGRGSGLRGFWLGIRVLLRFPWFVCEIITKITRNKFVC